MDKLAYVAGYEKSDILHPPHHPLAPISRLVLYSGEIVRVPKDKDKASSMRPQPLFPFALIDALKLNQPSSPPFPHYAAEALIFTGEAVKDYRLGYRRIEPLSLPPIVVDDIEIFPGRVLHDGVTTPSPLIHDASSEGGLVFLASHTRAYTADQVLEQLIKDGHQVYIPLARKLLERCII